MGDNVVVDDGDPLPSGRPAWGLIIIVLAGCMAMVAFVHVFHVSARLDRLVHSSTAHVNMGRDDLMQVYKGLQARLDVLEARVQPLLDEREEVRRAVQEMNVDTPPQPYTVSDREEL